ncbi:SNF2 family N-terminal domain/Type III restriction enzyme, res subunit/Helicase conserved C-terminal domain containing protein, putative [Angomonas deanei]|uniref:SNF2 family N-terminal domain/Type III restriction enzyme, res subunit/Helicase conserved C-terminal domain containing protein, putative n=1 Tax=Angomonas deanei TaxID=59799 RepID=A0A7G2CDA1_9TRYP|nr:SNF2 family N-terminal domain/Type III restriction enzyme, res subunit/Helicase conserved C-terminal domain containing protein, putative [Angomonas deanei]
MHASENSTPVLEDAPVITASSTGAVEGCVLRDYQVAGVQYLLNHFHKGLSCILSDDMGLGKTAQIASFLHCLKLFHAVDGPHLIISPLSTLTSWLRELARWAPGLRVVKYHGTKEFKRKLQVGEQKNAVYVSNAASLLGDRGFFKKKHWSVIVVDEAHILKGSKSNITFTAKKLKACFRIAVTGTPVHNNVTEVWNLIGFLYPKYAESFDNTSTDTIEAAEDCSRILKHLMLRRTKDSLELGIPPRIDHPVVYLDPTPIQKEVLSQLTAQALSESASDNNKMIGFLSHQRTTCNHPLALRVLGVDDNSSDIQTKMKNCKIPIDEENIILPSAKMMYLRKVLPKLREEGHRCLIFSNFTSTLDLIEAMCHLMGYSYERLDGNCNRVERELSIHRFNQPNSTIFLFLVTTTSGGVGVTLTGADTVFLYDAHFNPQMDRQAADRAHRIGQTRTVHIHRLCLGGTIEERIRQSADRKASLGDFIVESKMTVKEIRELLEAGLESPGGNTVVGGSDGQDKMADPDYIRYVTEFIRNGKMVKPKGMGMGNALKRQFTTSNTCFVCSQPMHPYEAMYRCIACPKVYHAECCGEPVPKAGESTNRMWTCSRHTCHSCHKTQSEEGAIFMCTGCPRAFCFDCLDPRYLVLDDTGTKLLNIQRDYNEMKEEGMDERRSNYYISCLYCCGVLSSSEEDESSGEEESMSESSEDFEEDSDDDSD